MSNSSEKIKGKTVNEKPKERKSIEETVVLLRKELQVLYESLKEKNENLLNLEEDLKCLKSENKELRSSIAPTCSTCHKKVLILNDQSTKHESLQAQSGTKSDCDTVESQSSLIQELNKKVIRLSDNLVFVQKESLAKDDRIDELQRQLDKFRQVVRPFTTAIAKQRSSEDFFLSPGVENTRVTLSTEPSRLKRTAIRFIIGLYV